MSALSIMMSIQFGMLSGPCTRACFAVCCMIADRLDLRFVIACACTYTTRYCNVHTTCIDWLFVMRQARHCVVRGFNGHVNMWVGGPRT